MGGCKTCGCMGCTKEDEINKNYLKSLPENMKNGCCKDCIKSYNKYVII